jgi:hypothetical protein
MRYSYYNHNPVRIINETVSVPSSNFLKPREINFEDIIKIVIKSGRFRSRIVIWHNINDRTKKSVIYLSLIDEKHKNELISFFTELKSKIEDYPSQ